MIKAAIFEFFNTWLHLGERRASISFQQKLQFDKRKKCIEDFSESGAILYIAVIKKHKKNANKNILSSFSFIMTNFLNFASKELLLSY